MTKTKDELKNIWSRDHGFKDWDDLIDQTGKHKIAAICDQINENYLAQNIGRGIIIVKGGRRSGKREMLKIMLAGGGIFTMGFCEKIHPADDAIQKRLAAAMEENNRKHFQIDPLKWPETKPLIQAEEIRGVIPDKYYKKKD